MSYNRIDGDLNVTGNLTAGSLGVNPSTVTDASVVAGAGISASKLEHQHSVTYAQANAAVDDATQVVHVAYASGTVIAVKAGSIAAAVGDATCTVDVKKNGTTILTGVITLDSGNAAYTPEAGSIDDGTYVADDVLSVVIDGTIGTGTLPTGVYVNLVMTEDAA